MSRRRGGVRITWIDLKDGDEDTFDGYLDTLTSKQYNSTPLGTRGWVIGGHGRLRDMYIQGSRDEIRRKVLPILESMGPTVLNFELSRTDHYLEPDDYTLLHRKVPSRGIRKKIRGNARRHTS